MRFKFDSEDIPKTKLTVRKTNFIAFELVNDLFEYQLKVDAHTRQIDQNL